MLVKVRPRQQLSQAGISDLLHLFHVSLLLGFPYNKLSQISMSDLIVQPSQVSMSDLVPVFQVSKSDLVQVSQVSMSALLEYSLVSVLCDSAPVARLTLCLGSSVAGTLRTGARLLGAGILALSTGGISVPGTNKSNRDKLQ